LPAKCGAIGNLELGHRGLEIIAHSWKVDAAHKRKGMAQSISRIASPIKAFVEDECEINPKATVEKDDLYGAFKGWCQNQDRHWHGNKETISKSLIVSCSCDRASKARDQGDSVPVYRGLRLKTARADELDLGTEPF
jgi:hypothetical protein